MKIGSKAFILSNAGELTLTHSGYTAVVTDRIILTPRAGTNAWPAEGSSDVGNIKAWVEWQSGSSTWKIKLSSPTFVGNVDYMIYQV